MYVEGKGNIANPPLFTFPILTYLSMGCWIEAIPSQRTAPGCNRL